MNNRIRSLLTIAALTFSLSAYGDLADMPSGAYALDKEHGYITFSYSHLGFSIPKIGFRQFDVTLDLNSAAPEKSQLNVMIDAASVDSRVADFDDHLNGEDFFDTAKFPEINFVATRIAATGADTFDVTGDLTIKGITKQVTLDARLLKAANHPMKRVPTLGFTATTKVKRTEFDLGKYAPAVGDDVDIEITVELPKVGEG